MVRGLSARYVRPRKFGPPTSNGCSACRENDLIRRVRWRSNADIDPSMCAVPESRTSRAGPAERASTQLFFMSVAGTLAGAGATLGERRIRLVGIGKDQSIIPRPPAGCECDLGRFQLPNSKHRLAHRAPLTATRRKISNEPKMQKGENRCSHQARCLCLRVQ
jgi:hypothetical protein